MYDELFFKGRFPSVTTILSHLPLRLRAFFSFIFLPFALAAQTYDIRGTVSDSLTGERIPYANIRIILLNRGAAANTSGFYLLPNIPPGTHTVTTSAIGYRTLIRRITIENSSLTVNLTLAPTSIELGEVVVSAEQEREVSKINTSVHVMRQEELRLAPVAVQQDIFHAFQILPGVVTTSDVSAKFFVRGGAGDQNLVMLDGMRIYGPFHALGIFSIFDPDVVSSSEVYTGAFPAEYGGRLSSVIHINTREGRSDRASARTHINLLSTKLQLEVPVSDHIRWIASARKSIFPQTFKELTRRDVPLSFYDVFLKMSADVPGLHKLSAQVLMSGDDLLSDNPRDADYTWRNKTIGLSVSGLVADRLFTSASVYVTNFESVRDPKQSRFLTPASTTVKEAAARIEATLYGEAGTQSMFGVDFSFPKTTYRLVNTGGFQRPLIDSFSEAMMWYRYQRPIGSLLIDVGIHTEMERLLKKGVRVLEPRISARHPLAGDWNMKVSYGRFSQSLITVSNEDDLISIFDAWIRIPNDDEPQRATHYVAGVEGPITRSFAATLQGYFKDFDNLTSYNRNKVSPQSSDYLGDGKAIAYGAELLLRFGSTLLDFYGAYSYGWVSMTAGGQTYYPRYDVRHHMNLLGAFRPWNNFELTMRWEFSSGYPFTQTMGFYDRIILSDPVHTPPEHETGEPYAILGLKNAARLNPYHRLDAGVTYRFEFGQVRGSVGVHIINLYNRKNVFYFERYTGQRIDMIPFFPSATVAFEY